VTEATQIKPSTKRLRKMARVPNPELAASGSPFDAAATDSADHSLKPDKPQSKSAQVLQLLGRPEGATIDQLVAATGWLSHTTRAALTGFRKKGHILASEKLAEGPRIYRVTGMARAGR
jgi:hypothetical protein